MSQIRNFCIIAHIDHGKSTLADRFLELTKTVPAREMRAQLLDQMDLERERGITIKLQPVRMQWQDYILNLIDTPGHVDFTYEVSRSLAAVEGAILLVDATQGIQAQTLSNLYLALEQNLTIIPVINKIDLSNARAEETSDELAHLLGIDKKEIILVSAKTGENTEKILEAIIKNVPPPQGTQEKPLRALIFDSRFDEYKGILAFLRIVDGELKVGDLIKLLATNEQSEVLEVGIFNPHFKPVKFLTAGEIGYIATGIKHLEKYKVGDTVAKLKETENFQVLALAGYKAVRPMVFAGLYPQAGDDFEKLKKAMDKLKLTDTSLIYQPESSMALGTGFRSGFLGLLHLDIIQERLKREYGLKLVITAPTVVYKVMTNKNEEMEIKSPKELPNPEQIKWIKEPWMKISIVSPENYIGVILRLIQERMGKYNVIEYLNQSKTSNLKNVIINAEMPLSFVIYDFHDKLKSVSSGYASFNYEFLDYRQAQISKLDILVAEEPVEALSILVHEDLAFSTAQKMVKSLKENLPRQMFEIKIQACFNGRIIAAERISAMRKDVIAKLYGGDVTRKMKLIKKQKQGKKKMKIAGKVEIPTQVFLNILKR